MIDNYINELNKIMGGFEGPQEVISFLRYEAIQNYITLTEYNLALREVLNDDEYLETSKRIAQNVFRELVRTLPESNFKNFCLEHMEEIIKDGNE